MSTKKAITILIILGLIGSAGVFYAAQKDKQQKYVAETIEKGTLVQTVSETGTVKSENEINLSFASGGTIDEIMVSVGDEVEEGDVLVELEHEDLLIKKREAEASVSMADQELQKLLSGAEDKDIRVARAGVRQAEKAYQSAKEELEKTRASVNENIEQAQTEVNDLESGAAGDVTTYEQAIKTAEINLENAEITYQKSVDNLKEQAWTAAKDAESKANNALDHIQRILDDDNAENKLSAQDTKYLDFTKKTLQDANDNLSDAASFINSNGNEYDGGDAMTLLQKMADTLESTYSALEYCYQALENSITGSGFTQTHLDNFKTTITSQQGIINASQTSIQSIRQNLEDAIITYDTKVSSAQQALAEARSAYDNALKQARNALSKAQKDGDKMLATARARVDNAEESLDVAKAELERLLAPASKHDIQLTRAKVRKAQAALESINKQISDSKLKAPMSGTITKKMFDQGEQVSPGTPVIAMLKQDNYEIEVLISEADIAKIKKGDSAIVTLDAFGYEQEFAAKVKFIEPAETTIQDVVYYKVTVLFDNFDKVKSAGIKPGMTANVTITTAEKNNVLLAPMRAIVERNGDGKFIRVLGQDSALQEQPVKTGLRGDGGNIEILSGVEAGTEVVTYIEEEE